MSRVRPSDAWRSLRRRLRLGSAPRTPEDEVDEEIRFHLDERIEVLRAEGLDEAAARREAERRFGSVDGRRRELLALTEARRRTTARRFSLAVWTEALRSATRVLLRRPLPAAAAILSLGFGLAAVAGVGALAEELLLRPPSGIDDPGRVVYLDATPSSPGLLAETLRVTLAASGPELGSKPGAERVPFASHLPGSLFAVRGETSPERVVALGVDGSFFSTLGVEVVRGRLLDRADDAERRQVAVISAALARRHFPGSDAVGQTLHIEGRPFVVVGVADEPFRGTFHGFPMDLWLPFQVVSDLDGTFDPDDLEADAVEMMARLPPGVSRDALAARLDAAVAGLRQSHPELRDLRVAVHPFTGFDPEEWPQVVAFVSLLLAVALGLLAVAASPVAMWLLVRGRQRRRELAIRAALGGGRLQLLWLLAAEGVWVGALGGLLGLALAIPTPTLVGRLLPPLPFELGIEPTLGPMVMAGVLGLAILVGCLASLPALARLRRASLSPGLGRRDAGGSGGSGGSGAAGDRLVVAQLAVACALLVVSGALVRGVRDTAARDPGVDLDSVVVAQRLDVGSLREDHGAFYAALVREAAALPGVESVGVTSRFPLSLFGSRRSAVSAPGVDPDLDPQASGLDPSRRDEMQTQVDAAQVDAGYFDTAGVELLRGRVFASSDGDGTDSKDSESAPRVAVVNETLARRWFGDGPGAADLALDGALEEAVGARLRIDGAVHTIVGVVSTGRYRSLAEDDLPFVYRPVAQAPPPRVDLVLRSQRPAAELSTDVRALLARLEPDLPAPALLTGREVVAARLLPQRLAAGVCAALGAVGLLLAGFAAYAVAAWRVGSRRHEYGVRLGLGASPADLRRSILLGGQRLAALGLALGAGLGWLGARAASGVVAGVAGAGPGVYLAVAGVLALSALLAGLGPALRAGRVDPAEILRTEG